MDHFWNYINLRPIVEMKSMSVSVVSTPPPECEIGDDFTLGIKYIGPEGPVTTASVSAMVTGDPTPYPMEHVGSGTYECDFDTSDWYEQDYTIRVEAKATGFVSELTTFAIESVEPVVEEPEEPDEPETPDEPDEPEEPDEPGFWESYGATVTGVVVVLAVIAVAATYMYGRKS
jgi:hypothetical protein